MDDPARHPRPGDEVGLGRVVDNKANLGTDETEGLDEASEASFPASDPPGFASEGNAPAPGRPDEPDRPLSDRPSA